MAEFTNVREKTASMRKENKAFNKDVIVRLQKICRK